jgi:hypothetical protein
MADAVKRLTVGVDEVDLLLPAEFGVPYTMA